MRSHDAVLRVFVQECTRGDDMKASDKDKLDLINAILPVMTELRRFYDLQFDEGMKSLKGIKDVEAYKSFMQFFLKESEKISRRLHGLAEVSWSLIDEVCESLEVAHHEFIEGIIDE